MRISELEKGLKEIKERCGDCLVVAVDEHLDSEKVLTRLQLSEANIEGQKGDRHRIALLEILSKQPDIEDGDPEDSDENPGYFRDLKTFHEQIIELMNTNVQLFEAHLCQVEKALKKG